jgi:nucleotide-binding universal stress UspA family protein
VLFVVEQIVPMTYGMGVMDTSPYDALAREAREAAQSTIEKAAARLRASRAAAQATITTSVGSGSPKRVILDTADAMRADLIVVGSHGYGAINRFLLGSVSQAVAQHAKCSVLIVRTPNEPERDERDADSTTSARPHQ